MALEAYTTSVVGSYSVPHWYQALGRQVETGALVPEDLADAHYRTTQAAILDQDVAGVDVLNGGELHRWTTDRHTPPDAMLDYFWAKIPGFSAQTRTKPVTASEPAITHAGAVLDDKIRYADLGLVDEFEMVSRYTGRAVKVTMTGPHMLAKVCHDEYYRDLSRVMEELAKVINANFRALEQAGCQHIQLDEPLLAGFSGVDRREVADAVEAINQCFEGVGAYRWMHTCQASYFTDTANGEDDGEGGYPVDEYPAEEIARIECDALMVEYDVVDLYRDAVGEQQVAIGAADVQEKMIESPEKIIQRVEAQRWLPPEQTLLTTSCGLNHLPRDIAYGKLSALSQARERMRAERR